MSWRKYFKSANQSGALSPLSVRGGKNLPTNAASVAHGPNLLPEAYTGFPNRIDRYQNFENMDQDSEINAALDILSEFSTQHNDQDRLCFSIKFFQPPTETEAKIIKERLVTWNNLNEFNKRLFRMFRNVLKYGDQIFVRDPETFKLNYVEMDNVVKVIVNESEGKKPEQYVIRNLNINLQNLTVTQVNSNNLYNIMPSGPGYNITSGQGYGLGGNSPYSGTGRFNHHQGESAIDAQNVMHLSLTEGLDPNWPFGTSILEMVFKVYKQKELLEDSIIIYRIQRAPERRVFNIAVGDMPSHLAMAFVEKVKNEIYQRRIPSMGESGGNFQDTTYSSLAPNMDFFFPVNSSGQKTEITPLPGGQNLDQIKDLLYFNNKMMRALRIPSSYLPTGPDESERSYTDGKVGNSLIQEYRFNQYCERLQRLVCAPLDTEFKAFLKWCGVNVDTSMFQIHFNPPQNFAHYRQAELDSSRLNNFTNIQNLPYISTRWAMKRFLGLNEDEMLENDRMWKEENDENHQPATDNASFRNVGLTPGSIQGDIDNFAPPSGGDLSDIGGDGDLGLGGDIGGPGGISGGQPSTGGEGNAAGGAPPAIPGV